MKIYKQVNMENVRFYYGMPLVDVKVRMVEGPEFDPYNVIGYFSNTQTRCPRVTIAALYDEKESTLRFGVTLCSAKDRFIKKTGREIALERAKNNPIKVIPVTMANIVETRINTFKELEIKALQMSPKKFI